MKLSEHFSLEEMTRTDTGLENECGITEGAALVRLCETALEPMRDKVGPLRINSGYRCPAVNKAVGGTPMSQHVRGEAADVFPLLVSPSVLFDLAEASSLPFDQLILEPNWVHVSIAPLTREPRRQCLKAIKTPGGMRYEPA